MKQIKINSLNIKIGEKEIKISIEEARKLQEALNRLFYVKVESEVLEIGESIVAEINGRKVIEHHHHYDPPFYWIPDTIPYWGNDTIITCGTGTLNIGLGDNNG